MSKKWPEVKNFYPTNPEKYIGDLTNIKMRSSWEIKFAKYCDTKEWNFQFIVIDNKFTEKIDINDLTNINFIDLESQGGLFVHN